ncbi:MAG: hypothetical protein LIP09_11970 [Bacteroidales bacterium]|nr:hypothetical protein [Bacteroidales bacterium]
MPKAIHIPRYAAEAILRHARAVIQTTKPNADNLRQYNALRMLGEDCKRLEKIMNQQSRD